MEHLLEVRKQVLPELRDTKITKALFAGTPDPRAYVRYLINAHYYAQYSPKVMAIAAARCMDTHPVLATYLLHHAGEEQGHEQWALEDLRDLNVNEAVVRTARPVPSCAAMVGSMHYIAGYANPLGLFGWMYVLEAVGDDLGTLVVTCSRKTGPADSKKIGYGPSYPEEGLCRARSMRGAPGFLSRRLPGPMSAGAGTL